MPYDGKSTLMPTAIHLQAGATVVEFAWASDRWRHEIRTADGRWWLSVESVGEGADPRWPQSPVLTEVSLAEVAGKPALLGIGLAGRSHFSLCVTVHAGLEDTLLFEAACRIHSVADRLGSSYRRETGGAVRVGPPPPFPVPPATVCWNYTAGPYGIVAVSPTVTQAAEG